MLYYTQNYLEKKCFFFEIEFEEEKKNILNDDNICKITRENCFSKLAIAVI
jgi:hypothetical protein